MITKPPTSLSTAVERYHDRCRFYAWDVYELLAAKYRRSLKVLGFISTQPTGVTVKMVVRNVDFVRKDGTQETLFSNVSGVLKDLRDMGLLTAVKVPRTKGGGMPAYSYTLSDFGKLIISFHDEKRKAE